MKIRFYTIGNISFLEGYPDGDDTLTSNRLEGAGVKIKLRNPLAFFGGTYKHVHPDVLGAICLSIFYPFIGRKVEFPYPVSARLVESINRPIFIKNKTIDVINIDHDLEKYQGNGTIVLSFGGGVDSSAVRAMFPEAFLVHEASQRNGNIVPDSTNNLIDKLQREGRGQLVVSNQRYMSDPGGWHVWIASVVTSALVACQIGASYIFTGSNLGAIFLSNGTKYFDRLSGRRFHGISGNYWEQVFWDIGLPVFSPVSGMSEILNMRTSLKELPNKEIFSCTANNGNPCHKCPKCFRRACIQEYVTNCPADYSSYKNCEVLRLLDTKPTYMGHIYTAMINSGWDPPAFARDKLMHLPKNIDFALRHNCESYEFFPLQIRNMIQDRLLKHSDIMSSDDIHAMRCWDQTI